MKYKYIGKIPFVYLVEGKMRTISLGETVDLPSSPSPEFVAVATKPARKPRKVTPITEPKVDAPDSQVS